MLIVKPFRVWHLKRWSLSRPQGQKKPQLQEPKRKLIAHVLVLNGCKPCWKKEAWLWKMLQVQGMEEAHGVERQEKWSRGRVRWNSEEEEKSSDLTDHPSKATWKSDGGDTRGSSNEGQRLVGHCSPSLAPPSAVMLMPQCVWAAVPTGLSDDRTSHIESPSPI